MRDLLVIFAYHFPPENAIGGVRPYRFAKYLSRLGVRTHTFTAADVSSRPDLDATMIADPFVTHPRQGAGWQVERAIRKFVLPGATGIQWARRAFRAACRFLESEPADSRVTILATYPPMGTPLAAYWLAKQRRLPWILDFRDPMGNNPGSGPLTAFQAGAFRFLERKLVKKADRIIANTDAAEARLKTMYPRSADKVQLLWNGFDPENRIEAVSIPAREQRIYSHIGELYGGRVITPLLLAIDRLIRSGKVAPSRILIQLVGPMIASAVPSPEFMAKAERAGWLRVTPEQVPQAEARRIMQESDGLLLVQPHSTLQVPGKLFEYVQVGRPVFAFILPETPIERILRQSEIPHVCGYTSDSEASLEESMLDFFGLDTHAVRPSNWFENGFNAQRHAEQLYQTILGLQENSGRANRPSMS